MKYLISRKVSSVKTHKSHQRSKYTQHKPQKSVSFECRKCARYATCTTQGQKYKLCGKLNPFAKMCRSGKKPKPRKSKPCGKVQGSLISALSLKGDLVILE